MSQRERPAPRGSPATGIAVPSADALPRLLDRLLAGDGPDDLPTFAEPTFIDDWSVDLDPRETAAVALALRTPDIALFRVSSAAVGQRIADAVIAAAGRRGEQVHAIGPQPGVCHCRQTVAVVYDQLGDLAWQHDELTTRQPVARPRGIFARLVGHIFGGSTGNGDTATQAAVVEREAAVITDKWQQTLRRLPADGPPPDAMTVPAVAAAREAWRAHCNGDGCGPADLLVVADAHAIADLPAAVGGASRAVLIGEPGIGPFDHLWTLLHAEAWRREKGRIVCRLRPVAGRLDAEPVADRPDVELRIHTPPSGEPEVAEVAFPGDTPIAVAVEWVFRELGEVAGVVAGSRRQAAGSTRIADLSEGIRAVFAPTGGGWSVPLIEFDCSDQERAAEWMRRHVVRPGCGRTMDLT
jgi:hypothetical protein